MAQPGGGGGVGQSSKGGQQQSKPGPDREEKLAKFGLSQPQLEKGGESAPGGEKADEELFHQEQKRLGNQPPWWKSTFFVTEPALFGTWDGVFTSTLINTFGIIVFLRAGWMVGNAGIGQSLLILFISATLALVPVLSAVGICERCQIQSGGVYFLISHILGARIGGAVGIMYTLGQAVAGALVAVGFGESMAAMVGMSESTHPAGYAWAIRGFAFGVTLLLVGINVAGVKWVIKVQLVLLVLLVLAVVDFMIGTFVSHDPEKGVIGYSRLNFINNTEPAYASGENFFSVFGVFFSTFTGVLSGVNMSGDLKNPTKSIPLGELSALGVNVLFSFVFVMSLGAVCDRQFLYSDPMIAKNVSLTSFFFLGGLYVSTLSSILGSLYGAPRVLQCIAADNIVPFMKPLEKGRGPNKVPVLAIVVITAITFGFILIGSLNTLAKIATMPYLLTYAFINYSYVSLAMTHDLQQQRAQLQSTIGGGLPASYGSMDQIRATMAGVGAPGTAQQGGDDLERLFPERTGGTGLKTDDDTDPEKHSLVQQPRSWYAIFCNRWVALVGAALNFVLIIFVHWIYGLAHFALLGLIYFYIKFANPGAFPGISEFSIAHSLRTVLSRWKPPKEGAAGSGILAAPPGASTVILPPAHPGVETSASKINDPNPDYAARGQYHQSQTRDMEHDYD